MGCNWSHVGQALPDSSYFLYLMNLLVPTCWSSYFLRFKTRRKIYAFTFEVTMWRGSMSTCAMSNVPIHDHLMNIPCSLGPKSFSCLDVVKLARLNVACWIFQHTPVQGRTGGKKCPGSYSQSGPLNSSQVSISIWSYFGWHCFGWLLRKKFVFLNFDPPFCLDGIME